MTFSSPWEAPGRFAKAQLHCHTTNSDGRVSPDWAAAMLYRCGYDIIAITDHNTVTPRPALEREGLTFVPGIELGCPGPGGKHFHIVSLGLGADEHPKLDATAGEALAAIRQAGGFGFIAHPYWSSLTAQDMTGLGDCPAVEVYNHGCEAEIAKGLSSVHWDDCLRLGDRYLPIAVDDAHMHGYDALGGWTWVRIAEDSPEAVVAALKAGHYYASCGPEIHCVSFDGSTIRVECSPAREIRFVAADTAGFCECSWGRPPITRSRYVVGGRERYVRIEIVDEAGRRAWAPPIFLD